MSNDLVSVGAAPIVPMQPLQQMPNNLADRPSADFSKALAAELENARAQTGGAQSVVPSLAKIMAPYTSAAATPSTPLTAPNTPAAQALPAAPTPLAPPPVPAPVVDTADQSYPAKAAAPLHAPAVPVAQPAAAAAVSPPTANMGNNYTVQMGDSLSKIARRLGGDSSHWHKLYELNRSTVGANPDLIRPGQVLTLPGTWVAHAPTHQQAKLEVTTVAATPAAVAVAPPNPVAAPPADEAAPVVAAAHAAPRDATLEPEPQQAAAPVENGPSIKYPAFTPPTNAHEAEEAIERISVAAPKPGSLVGAPPEASEAYENNVAALHDALKLVPTDSPDYAHFKQTADAYEAAVNGAGIRAGAPGPVVSAAPAGAGVAANVTDSNQIAATPSDAPRNPDAVKPADVTPANAASSTRPPAAPSVNPDIRPADPAPTPMASAPQAATGEDLDAPPVGFL